MTVVLYHIMELLLDVSLVSAVATVSTIAVFSTGM